MTTVILHLNCKKEAEDAGLLLNTGLGVLASNPPNTQNSQGAPDIALFLDTTEYQSGDLYDFGFNNFTNGDYPIRRTFTIKNLGIDPLNLTGIPRVAVSGSPFFQINIQPGTPVPNDTPTTFELELYCCNEAVQTALLIIESDDPDESSFTLSVAGTPSQS